jgi:N6-L-threonylcarbamoyladenine synthase
LKEEILILSIESSCDDTSAAVLKNTKVLSNVTASQKVHEQYGGVVPELASRAHQQHIVPVVQQALLQANITTNQLDAIGYTRGPGLLGSLLVGSSFAKGLSLALQIPLLEVNHMQAHILAHFIDDAADTKPSFPFICLTVSGGHTQLVLVKNYHKMQLIGSTKDDAVGEAYDKLGKMLDLAYPAGPIIDKLAQTGNANAFTFPMAKMDAYDFSFSGLKTSVLYFLQKEMKENPDFIQQNLEHICASFQQNVVTTLLNKAFAACEHYGVKQLAIAGGVSANSLLRSKLQEISTKKNIAVYIPAFEYCTDNAAMIGISAYFKYVNKDFSTLHKAPVARLEAFNE